MTHDEYHLLRQWAGAADPDDAERRTWLIATGAMGGVAAGASAVPIVSSFAPSERARARGAAVAVDIGDIPPGGMKTVEWRGKPVWVARRVFKNKPAPTHLEVPPHRYLSDSRLLIGDDGAA